MRTRFLVCEVSEPGPDHEWEAIVGALNQELSAFAEGDADLDKARQLRSVSERELLALVAVLVADARLGHLEALATAGLGKVVKKAARKGLYQLRSSGVQAESTQRRAVLSKEVTLQEIGIALAPGISGQTWLMAAGLPGSQGFEIDLKPGGDVARMERYDGLTRARLRRVLREVSLRPEQGQPMLANASLMVRMIDTMLTDLKGNAASIEPRFEVIKHWRDVAVGHGADPRRYDAREALAGPLSNIDINLTRTAPELFDESTAGSMIPPTHALEAMFQGVEAAVSSAVSIERPVFDERLRGLACSAADAWLASEDVCVRVRRWLDASADLQWANDASDRALQLLWLSDQIGTADLLPHELPFMTMAFERTMDQDLAWEHYMARLNGDADHGQEHVHGPHCNHD